ncbi:response regulator [Candidatus Magnetaquicoccus inordinatus]|uniref:response regulator n=1 Tax=Candidatus Magnetaquicoccus inordinatus TaxID=2496818 RepID=UPI00187D171D|nr:response regulator [Candidatus Magnetaquicoccus inordinatus]
MKEDDGERRPVVFPERLSERRGQSAGHLDSQIRLFLDHIMGAVVITDLEGRILEFNTPAEQLFGLQREAVLGRAIDACIIPPELQERHRVGLRDLASQPAERLFPYAKKLQASGLHSSGQRIELEINLVLVEFRRRPGLMASFQDMTARKQFSSVLQDTLQVAELLYDKNVGELSHVKELERRAFSALQTQQLIADLLRISLETGPLEELLQRAMDRIALMECVAADSFVGAVFLAFDKDQPLQLFASVPHSWSTKTHVCPYVSVNVCHCYQEGVPLFSLEVFMPADQKQGGGQNHRKQPLHLCVPLLWGKESVGVLYLQMPMGKKCQEDEFKALLDGVSGSLANLIWRSRMDTALRETKEKAEAASRAKSEFLANMSHEIRSPLNAIIGLTDLMCHTEMSGSEIKENLAIINSSSLSLQDLINGILDLSKIEAGHFILECAAFDLVRLLDDVCNLMAVKAHQKGLELYCRVAQDLSPYLLGDALRLKQILVNLINNAIKFTQAGEVVLAVKRFQSEESSSKVVKLQFSVTDTGVGISRGDQEKIFENFIQADGSVARKHGGTGLGLAISRHLVRLMGGQLLLTSQSGQGSCFYFSLELGVDDQPGARERTGGLKRRRKWEAADRKVLSGTRVLVADGHTTGRAILEEILTGHGAQIVLVADMQAMLSELAQTRDHPFDWVMVDEVILQTGELPIAAGASGSVPAILMMSARSSVLTLDPSGFFPAPLIVKKPVSAAKLLRIFSRDNAAVPADDHSPNPRPMVQEGGEKSLRILLVDDLTENQRLASLLLQKQGHRVRTAANGLEALAILRVEAFDLILMDLQMPEMDGFETTVRIREGTPEEVGNPQIPIVAVTAMGMMNERDRCFSVGMNGFLLKPYRVQQLVAAVAPFARSKPVRAAVTLTPNEMDQEALARLQDQFVQEAGGRLEQLQRGLDREDAGGVMRAIHWFRDLAGHIGASRVSAQAVRLSGQVEMGEWDSAANISKNLAQQVDKVILLLSNKEQ